MEKTKVFGFYYGFTKPKNEHQPRKDPIIMFRELEEYNQPIYIYDQFGWEDGCRKRNGRKIYPPFVVRCIDEGDEYFICKYEITCSKVEHVKEEE